MQEEVVSHIVDSVIVIWVSSYLTFFILAFLSLLFYNIFNVTVYIDIIGDRLFPVMKEQEDNSAVNAEIRNCK